MSIARPIIRYSTSSSSRRYCRVLNHTNNIYNNSNNNVISSIKSLITPIRHYSTASTLDETSKPQAKQLLQSLLDVVSSQQSTLNKTESDRLAQYIKDLKLNDSLCEFHLGTFFAQGIGMDKADADKALFWYKRAADHDLAEGQYALGIAYLSGSALTVFKPVFPSLNAAAQAKKGANNNKSTTIIGEGWISNDDAADFDYFKWLQQERQRVRELKESGSIYRQEQLELARKKEGLRWLTLSAIQGYWHAQLTLGLVLLQGKYGMEQNEKKALYWLDKASKERVDLEAMHQVGLYYYAKLDNGIQSGELNPRHKAARDLQEKAFDNINVASNRGLAEATYWLASFFLGVVNKQPVQSVGFQLLLRAAEQGSAKAATMLALLHHNGEHPDKFRRFIKLGVAGGDPVALLCMGEVYFSGQEGYQINYKKALYYFSESAALGNSDAALNQGVMYYNGYGTDIDYETSFYCYQNSYQYNPKNIAAITNLYMMHSEGIGAPKSPELANFYETLRIKLEQEQATSDGKGSEPKPIWWFPGNCWIKTSSSQDGDS
ncbi:hypothetical protein SAMD00019534_038310 [Acytostelium subglobosum LB1]|uniref:hypothetical protein n=1 Tax=Acytostelium subglobosum LB1 TaxID=1410327 RepID=UPI000644961A|nr:hypothetical protein SAMD00019534_038310 [Acytostelium subglobosum LB1]GAM20656.1 hypothetical protein SAMD00019534_038310 [Acytostelium subglobosum LB1]|eukprot:XP_012760177.1 hypothetical protein SAMD00019534_038310 [Acytostelium subglobosum LB1]